MLPKNFHVHIMVMNRFKMHIWLVSQSATEFSLRVFCVYFTEEIKKEDLDPEDLQPFPTLKQCFEAVDLHTGFNIEIKYPQGLQVCTLLYHVMFYHMF